MSLPDDRRAVHGMTFSRSWDEASFDPIDRPPPSPFSLRLGRSAEALQPSAMQPRRPSSLDHLMYLAAGILLGASLVLFFLKG
jgi:hypothetical protein